MQGGWVAGWLPGCAAALGSAGAGAGAGATPESPRTRPPGQSARWLALPSRRRALPRPAAAATQSRPLLKGSCLGFRNDTLLDSLPNVVRGGGWPMHSTCNGARSKGGHSRTTHHCIKPLLHYPPLHYPPLHLPATALPPASTRLCCCPAVRVRQAVGRGRDCGLGRDHAHRLLFVQVRRSLSLSLCLRVH